MKLKGIVLRNDDMIPDDVDLDALVLPEYVRCVADFDSSKPVGQARIWRDDDGNIMADVEVETDAEKYIVLDMPGYSIGSDMKLEGREVSRYQHLTCSVILPLKGQPSQSAPSLLDVAVVPTQANDDDNAPPMVIEC